jgi:hypothetical protein
VTLTASATADDGGWMMTGALAAGAVFGSAAAVGALFSVVVRFQKAAGSAKATNDAVPCGNRKAPKSGSTASVESEPPWPLQGDHSDTILNPEDIGINLTEDAEDEIERVCEI